MTGVGSHAPTRRRPALLGLRRRPGRIALAVFTLPLPLYRLGWGRLLGRTFLLVVHEGRKTAALHQTVAMTLRDDAVSREAVVCSVWGPDTDWIRNLHAHPARRVDIGRESFTPVQRFLDEDEAFAVAVEFRRRHPRRLRLIARILGLDDLRFDPAVRAFVATRPFVAFRPAARRTPSAGSITVP